MHALLGTCYGSRDSLLLLLKLIHFASASTPTVPYTHSLVPLFELIFLDIAKNICHLNEAMHVLRHLTLLLVKGDMSTRQVVLPLSIPVFHELQNPFLGEGLASSLHFKSVEELDRFEDFILQLLYALTRKLPLVKIQLLPLLASVVKLKLYQERRFSELYLDCCLYLAPSQALHWTRPWLSHICHVCFKHLASSKPTSFPFSVIKSHLQKLTSLLEYPTTATMMLQALSISELSYLKWLKSPLFDLDNKVGTHFAHCTHAPILTDSCSSLLFLMLHRNGSLDGSRIMSLFSHFHKKKHFTIS